MNPTTQATLEPIAQTVSKVRHRPGIHQPCKHCGAPARVSVLKGYRRGVPAVDYFCLGCADEPARWPSARRLDDRVRSGLPLIVFGSLCGILAILSDHIPGFTGTHPGLGLMQQSGLAIGAAALILGALLRIDLVSISGGLLLMLVIGADLVALSRVPGLGWKQALVIAASCAVILAGILRQRAGNGTPSSLQNIGSRTCESAMS